MNNDGESWYDDKPIQRRFLTPTDLAYQLAVNMSQLNKSFREVKHLVSCLSLIDPDAEQLLSFRSCVDELELILEEFAPETRQYYYQLQTIFPHQLASDPVPEND